MLLFGLLLPATLVSRIVGSEALVDGADCCLLLLLLAAVGAVTGWEEGCCLLHPAVAVVGVGQVIHHHNPAVAVAAVGEVDHHHLPDTQRRYCTMYNS